MALDKVKAGTQVVWLGGYESYPHCNYRKVTVTKVLKTHFVTDDGMKWNKWGEERGSKSSRPARIMNSHKPDSRYALMTWEEADERDAAQAQEIKRKRLGAEVEKALGMFSFDLATMEEVAKLLTGALAAREDDYSRVDADYLTGHMMPTLAEYMRNAE